MFYFILIILSSCFSVRRLVVVLSVQNTPPPTPVLPACFPVDSPSAADYRDLFFFFFLSTPPLLSLSISSLAGPQQTRGAGRMGGRAARESCLWNDKQINKPTPPAGFLRGEVKWCLPRVTRFPNIHSMLILGYLGLLCTR
ncbi:hypothetical protein LX36DRAFT_126148 [Colletotrichum falcatum]|nr:hypothetical protein LX36DRAFT_126148 [Colletotrichum falcatum]